MEASLRIDEPNPNPGEHRMRTKGTLGYDFFGVISNISINGLPAGPMKIKELEDMYGIKNVTAEHTHDAEGLPAYAISIKKGAEIIRTPIEQGNPSTSFFARLGAYARQLTDRLN